MRHIKKISIKSTWLISRQQSNLMNKMALHNGNNKKTKTITHSKKKTFIELMDGAQTPRLLPTIFSYLMSHC